MYARIKAGDFDLVEAIRFLAGVLEEVAPVAEAAPVAPREGLYMLFPDRVAKVLIAAGLETPRSVMVATDDLLRGINGVGPTTLREIRELLPREVV